MRLKITQKVNKKQVSHKSTWESEALFWSFEFVFYQFQFEW